MLSCKEVYCKVAAKQVNIALSTLAPLLIMNVYWKTMYMSRHTPHYVAMWKWGEGSWIGAGAVINPGVKIGKWTIIGSGSVVCKDIPDGVTACGSPCRIIKNNPQP